MRRYQQPGGERSPFRTVRWLGSAALENPLIRMLHEYRALMTARDTALPLEERPAYKFRRARVFAKGRDLGVAHVPPVPAGAGDAASAAVPPPADAVPERPGDRETL